MKGGAGRCQLHRGDGFAVAGHVGYLWWEEGCQIAPIPLRKPSKSKPVTTGSIVPTLRKPRRAGQPALAKTPGRGIHSLVAGRKNERKGGPPVQKSMKPGAREGA